MKKIVITCDCCGKEITSEYKTFTHKPQNEKKLLVLYCCKDCFNKRFKDESRTIQEVQD